MNYKDIRKNIKIRKAYDGMAVGYVIKDIATDFIPIIGEFKSALQFVKAIQAGEIGEALLSALGVIPGSGVVKGASKATKIGRKAILMKEAAEDLADLSKRRPLLAKAIADGDINAKKVEDILKKVADGKVTIPEEAQKLLKAGEFDPESVIIPHVNKDGYQMSTAALTDAAAQFGKIFPNGNGFVPQVVGGVKGIDKMDTPFLLGKATKYKAQFATDDIITAIYYSGFGKSNATKNIIKSIENSSASRQSKDYALNKLDELTVLLQKHTERENPSKYVYPISSYGKQWGRVSAEDSKLRAAAKYPYGKIPESLINPTTVADVRDRLKIERLAQELSAWFGAGRQSSGTVELFGNIQLPNNANAKGNRFDNLGKVTLTDAFGKVIRFQKNGIITSDNVAEETARNALTILKNVKDGGGIANDVIFGTDTYRTLRFKNGSRIEQIRKLRTKVTS